jgi:hypothetical protein
VTLAVGWSADSAETFPVLDPAAETLVTQREAMTVSWFATDGVIGEANSGRATGDDTLFTTTTWTAPSHPGAAHLFFVLHDDRGGIDFAQYDLKVQ